MAATEEKRRQILDAAVRVFARTGYHDSRVGDIARDAGVAYGLVYHYFQSKDEVLEAVFREAWGMLLAALRDVEKSPHPAPEQLRLVTKIVLRSWRDDPGATARRPFPGPSPRLPPPPVQRHPPPVRPGSFR